MTVNKQKTSGTNAWIEFCVKYVVKSLISERLGFNSENTSDWVIRDLLLKF